MAAVAPARPDGAAGATHDATGLDNATEVGRLAAAMLARQATSQYSFSFTPFLQTTYQHRLAADRPLCKAYSAGHCPLGARCPDRHSSTVAAAAAMATGGGGYRDNQGFISLVCKHWLRGLCKKGEGCEFLHEYNLRKMPECNFFLRNGYCSNGDECLYLHIDPKSKLPPCPDYDNRGFCALGPDCPKKHVRRKNICPYYLAGFCPEGARNCKAGGHPKWSPVALVAPQVAAEQTAALAAANAAVVAGSPLVDTIGDVAGAESPTTHQAGDDYSMGGTDTGDASQSRGGFRGGFQASRGRGMVGSTGSTGGAGGSWRGHGATRATGFRGRGH